MQALQGLALDSMHRKNTHPYRSILQQVINTMEPTRKVWGVYERTSNKIRKQNPKIVKKKRGPNATATCFSSLADPPPQLVSRGREHCNQDLIRCVKIGVYYDFLCTSWVLITLMVQPLTSTFRHLPLLPPIGQMIDYHLIT